MRITLIAALALSAFVGAAGVAKADDFGGQQQSNAVANQAYLDQQATNSGLSDPTAPNSIRSHGRP